MNPNTTKLPLVERLGEPLDVLIADVEEGRLKVESAARKTISTSEIVMGNTIIQTFTDSEGGRGLDALYEAEQEIQED